MAPRTDLVIAFTLSVIIHGSILLNVVSSENSGLEFDLEIDEVFLTDLQAEKVETQHLMPGKGFFQFSLMSSFIQR